jgi:hypothetical protein
MTCFILFGLIFIALGIMILVSTQSIKEVIVPYNTGNDSCKVIGKKCNITFTIPETFDSPTYAFYELKNYYQNYRQYFKSKSLKQLMGNYLSVDDLNSEC